MSYPVSLAQLCTMPVIYCMNYRTMNYSLETGMALVTSYTYGRCYIIAVDQIHKFHNVPVPYPKIQHSEQKYAYFCSEWCIVGYGTGALWDLWDWCITWRQNNLTTTLPLISLCLVPSWARMHLKPSTRRLLPTISCVWSTSRSRLRHPHSTPTTLTSTGPGMP